MDESPDTGLMGVGEGSTRQLKFLFEHLGIAEAEWMAAGHATDKRAGARGADDQDMSSCRISQLTSAIIPTLRSQIAAIQAIRCRTGSKSTSGSL